MGGGGGVRVEELLHGIGGWVGATIRMPWTESRHTWWLLYY